MNLATATFEERMAEAERLRKQICAKLDAMTGQIDGIGARLDAMTDVICVQTGELERLTEVVAKVQSGVLAMTAEMEDAR